MRFILEKKKKFVSRLIVKHPKLLTRFILEKKVNGTSSFLLLDIYRVKTRNRH